MITLQFNNTFNESTLHDQMKSAYKSVKSEIAKQKSKLDFLTNKLDDLTEIDSTIYQKVKADIDDFLYDSTIVNPHKFVEFLLEYNATISDQISLYGYNFDINTICPNSNFWTISIQILVGIDPTIVNISSISDLYNYLDYLQDATCEITPLITSKK